MIGCSINVHYYYYYIIMIPTARYTVVSRYYDITGVDKIYRIIRTIVITIRPYLDKFQLVGDNTRRKVANCISSKVLLQ